MKLPLYPAEFSYSLSELDVAPEFARFFGQGHVLASMHRHRFLHRKVEPAHLFYDAPTGLVRNISAKMERADLDPQGMASDFIRAFETFEPGAFHSMLAGYVQSASIQIEPLMPGYVRAFISTIGGNPTYIPLPRSNQAEVPGVLAALGLTLDHLGTGPTLRPTGSPAGSLSNYGAVKVLAVTTALLACGLDAAIAPVSEDDGVWHDIKKHLRQLAEMGAETSMPEDVPGASVVSVILGLMTQNVFPVALTDAIVDTVDHVAAVSDRFSQEDPSCRPNSVWLAQISATFVGAMSLQPRDWELRCITMAARHGSLNWFDTLLAGTPNRSVVLAEMAYANSRALTFTRAYGQVEAAESKPWSCLRRAITLSRQMIASVDRHVASGKHVSGMKEMLAAAVRRLGASLGEIITPEHDGVVGGDDSGANALMQETEWVLNIRRQLQKHGLDDPELVKTLNRGISLAPYQEDWLYGPVAKFWR